MSDNKELNREELNKVSGGALHNLEFDKYYCIATATNNASGFPLPISAQLGPHDTFEQAKDDGLAWATDLFNKGCTNIQLVVGQNTSSGWKVIEKINYPE